MSYDGVESAGKRLGNEDNELFGNSYVLGSDSSVNIVMDAVAAYNSLDARKSNYLAAYSVIQNDASISWVDISTGSFYISSVQSGKLGSELARLSPTEFFCPVN